MKKLFILAAIILLWHPVHSQQDSSVAIPEGNFKLNDLTLQPHQLKKFEELTDILNDNPVPFAKKEVILEDELIQLFDPESFKCDCDPRLVKNIKKLVVTKKEGSTPEKNGFIPVVVKQRIENLPAIKITGYGSAILANSFTYNYTDSTNKTITKSASIMDSPSAENFNIENYFQYAASNFLYNIDCSGYLSAVLSADVGVSGNSVETSARAAIKNSASLIIIAGIMNSPLYQAYKGTGYFKANDKLTLQTRMEILTHINKAVPNYADKDETVINIPTDYKVVVTSNQGKSSFNGEGSLAASTGTGFGFGSFSVKGKGEGEVERKSSFSDFNCYVTTMNNLNSPDNLVLKDIRNKINELKKSIADIK